jgi:DNA-binding GntR family transcriptional regulator
MIEVGHMAEYRTMTEIATETIREAILRGDFRPGTRLKPIELESELNLGRVAIREALRELSGTGLVVSIPNKGSTVAEFPTIAEMREVFEIRFLLEPRAAELATPKISEEGLSELRDLHERMYTDITDRGDFFFRNRDFHLEIYEASGWHYLNHLILQLFNQVQGFRSIYPFRDLSAESEWFRDVKEDHERILQALERRKAGDVRELVLTNIRKGLEDILATCDSECG